MLLLSWINMYSLHHSSQTKFHSTFDNFILCVEDHIQRVEANSSLAHWTSVKSGVYQDSLLGPILSNVFISYINSRISYSLTKFVDNQAVWYGWTHMMDRMPCRNVKCSSQLSPTQPLTHCRGESEE